MKELRLKEEHLVESIRYEIKQIDPDCEVIYLPNIIPTDKVKYFFIAMEPSFGRWAKDEESARRMIRGGFRNFILTWDDFTFHYSITKFLSHSYYVTDVSQAAMKVKNANYWRNRIYPKWIELLEEEIEILGQEDCKILFVGQKVEKFLEPLLTNNRLSNREVLKTILHYSGQAGKQRKEMAMEYPEEFQKFKANQALSSSIVSKFAKNFLKESGIPIQMTNKILEGLRKSKVKLSESRKELMFTYYKEFQEIRQSSSRI